VPRGFSVHEYSPSVAVATDPRWLIRPCPCKALAAALSPATMRVSESLVRRYNRSFTVRTSARQSYALWRDHATLAADFAGHVSAMMYGARTRWRVDCGPDPIMWETVCTADVPGRLLSWKTVTSERASHSWDLWFTERADGWGTDIDLSVVLEGQAPSSDDQGPGFGNSLDHLQLLPDGPLSNSDPLLDPDPDFRLDQLIQLWQTRLAQPY